MQQPMASHKEFEFNMKTCPAIFHVSEVGLDQLIGDNV